MPEQMERPQEGRKWETPDVRELEQDAYESLEISGETEEKAHEEAAELRKSIEAMPEEKAPTRYREDLYGAFGGEKREGGKIVLGAAAKEVLETEAEAFRKSSKMMTNAISGEKTPAEYDNRTKTFGSQSRFVGLPDGRRAVVMHDGGSGLHRSLDTLMKRAQGHRMRKASRDEWKTWVEGKSRRPPIETSDPHTVAFPADRPLVSGHDVFAKNKAIEDFGPFGWAKGAGREEKMELLDNLVDEVKDVHASGTAWGELILPHVDFTEGKKAMLREPELRYDDDVPLTEAKARDLRDLCVSVAGAMAQAEDQDPDVSVSAILGRYGDPDVIAELKKLAVKKRGLLQNLTFGYEKERTGVTGKKQYDAILKAIAAYEAPEKSA